MPSEISQAEIQRWLGLLRSALSSFRGQGAVRTGGRNSKSPLRQPSLKLLQVIEALEHEEPEVRRAVMFACGQLGDDRAIEVLQRFLKSDVAADVRCEAVDALEKIGGRDVLDLLKQTAAADRNPDVQVRAVRALANLEKLKGKADAAKSASP